MLLGILLPASHQDFTLHLPPVWAFSVFCPLSEEVYVLSFRGPMDPRKTGALLWQVVFLPFPGVMVSRGSGPVAW